jgi:hypothetical protein
MSLEVATQDGRAATRSKVFGEWPFFVKGEGVESSKNKKGRE